MHGKQNTLKRKEKKPINDRFPRERRDFLINKAFTNSHYRFRIYSNFDAFLFG